MEVIITITVERTTTIAALAHKKETNITLPLRAIIKVPLRIKELYW
jgi:hypothetical protein